jgi:DNA-binding MarR family transcriptional regulator
MTVDAAWLSPAELRTWMTLSALMEALPSAVDAQLKRDAGINRFEYVVLAALSESPDRSLLMSELTTIAAGSISRLSHAIGRLESQGWVTRRPYPEDGRHTQVTLTDAGMDKVVATAPGHVREARRLVIDTLTSEQLSQLGAAAARILEVASPEIAALTRRFS